MIIYDETLVAHTVDGLRFSLIGVVFLSMQDLFGSPDNVDLYLILLDTIIDGKWKPLGKKTMVPPKMDAMYSRKQPERLDIRKQGLQEIANYAGSK